MTRAPQPEADAPTSLAQLAAGAAASEVEADVPSGDVAEGDASERDASEHDAADVRFSTGHGFFDEPFTVSLTTGLPGATIHYTTDGGPPDAAHGRIYDAAIPITTTTVLRAVAYANDDAVSPVGTQTYIFPDAVVRQPAAPPGAPAMWDDERAVYGMESGPAGGADQGAALRAALLALPSLSISLDGSDLFGAERGIYAWPEDRGPEWERPASAEWIVPGGLADGGDGFQIDAGLRIQGHWNRRPEKTPKHSLRLLFKARYGPGRLDYPLFPDSDVASFNTLTLRGGFNDSWLVDVEGQRRRAQYIRDEWARASQRAMGWPAPHGRFAHLYLNGLYWGVYNLVERPDDAFAADYLGGEREEYDALQHGELVAGRDEDWQAMLGLARNGLGSPATYAALEDLLDVDNLIDYMLLYLYTADDDWPKRNWYAARQRLPGAGWRFFVWDGERGLKDAALDIAEVHGGDNPTLPYHHARLDSPEFRLRFADHVQRHLLTPGGALYVCGGKPRWDHQNPGCNVPAARFIRLAGEIETALLAESARWGGYRQPEQPLSPAGAWRAEQARLLADYFPRRSGVLLDQLRRVGLYPPIDPPFIAVDPDRRVVHLDPRRGEEVFYTIDGTDPRVPGSGAVAAGARRSGDPIPLAAAGVTLVKARAREGDTWSALVEAVDGVPDLRISELMYHPTKGGHEFVELVNRGPTAAPLYDPWHPGQPWRIAGGARFAIPYGTVLPPGGRLVITGGVPPAAFRAQAALDTPAPVLGPFAGKLDNGGETVLLLRPAPGGPVGGGDGIDRYLVVDQVAYADEAAWPRAADGEGPSLERAPLDGDGTDPASWDAGPPGGTPGR